MWALAFAHALDVAAGVNRLRSLLSREASPVRTAAEWPEYGAGSFLEFGEEFAKADCKSHIVSEYITQKPDWQLAWMGDVPDAYHAPSFEYMKNWYNSIRAHTGGDVRATLLHDLPEELVETYAHPQVEFQRVDVRKYPRLSANDARFKMRREFLQQHPELKDVPVFFTDVSDVTVHVNPCKLLQSHPDKDLFVGDEAFNKTTGDGRLKPNPFFDRVYGSMGSKYQQWYNSYQPTEEANFAYNAGIIGGKRERLMSLLEDVSEVIDDPNLRDRKWHTEGLGGLHVNMGALNWVMHNRAKPDEVFHGSPLNSHFKSYENWRQNVSFVHK